MDLPFDTRQTDVKLAEAREHEEEDVARILSDKYGMQYTDLSMKDIDSDALRLIPETEAQAASVIAFAKTGKHLSLALQNPNKPTVEPLLADLTERGFTFDKFLVSEKSIEWALKRYSELSLTTGTKAGVFSMLGEAVTTLSAAGLSKATLQKSLDDVISDHSPNRLTRIFEVLLAGAFALRASDIHLEPREESAVLRMRIDGLLTDIYTFDTTTFFQLISRIKLLSGVKINVTNRAQDGRFSITRAQGDVEMRTSFIPENYGESAVMRILNPEATKVSYKDLGINAKLLARLETEIRRPNGMLLTTGPTGSGKTTTLYSFLRELYSPEIKIITIEDPVEYHLSGIVQTQVDEKRYTFAEGLRSIVRQDPDIIMVGEIRDGETADIAIQAALTGHFVLSTLHTNNAAGTFPRLADLGADPKSFGSAITVSMAQRLLRTLNQETKKERPLTDDEKAMIAKVFAPLADQSLLPEKIETVWEPTPNVEIGDTGYKGRIGLYEAIFMDDEMAALLRDNPPSNEIAKAAEKQGYLTMAQDGILKALAGVTSLSEVLTTVEIPR